jgi:hypothetical protein
MKINYFAANIFFCFCFIVLSLSSVSYAAHPLITDDTGTQGKGKFQVELDSEFSFDKEKDEGITTKERDSEVSTVMSYGITDNIDIVLGLPYQWMIKEKEDGDVTADENGISDISIEVKWMFYEKYGFSAALKPGITLPTGDDEKGLGTGRVTSSLFLIATEEIEPWAFHFNLGYIRNENRSEERKDIWHASLASEVEVANKLTLVANVGIEKNPDKVSTTDPAFILGGVIYSVTDAFDIDFGLTAGLNKPETDYSVLAGANFRF